MSRHNFFWGALILLIGLAFLASSLGWFQGVNIWNLIWPFVLISMGLWFVFSTLTSKNRPLPTSTGKVNLGNAVDAEIILKHGAGKLEVGTAIGEDVLLEGNFTGEVEQKEDREGEHVRVVVQANPRMMGNFPGVLGSTGFSWKLGLTPKIPLTLKVESGASDTSLDLSELKVTDLKIDTGASSTRIILPEKAGTSNVKISAGAASIDITVPGKVAARIKLSTAISGNKVDNDRFPWNGSMYESTDYETAKNKVDIKIDSGVGTVDIK
jgi:hypothetical protein